MTNRRADRPALHPWRRGLQEPERTVSLSAESAPAIGRALLQIDGLKPDHRLGDDPR